MLSAGFTHDAHLHTFDARQLDQKKKTAKTAHCDRRSMPTSTKPNQLLIIFVFSFESNLYSSSRWMSSKQFHDEEVSLHRYFFLGILAVLDLIDGYGRVRISASFSHG